LGTIFQQKPQKASEVMIKLLAWHKGNTLDSFLSQFPVKQFDTDDELTWDCIASNERNIPLVEAYDTSYTLVKKDGVNVGANMQPFYLVFAEDYFANGEILFGNLNEVYPMRVLGEPTVQGTNYVYKVEAYGFTGGVPAERLLAGELFSYAYAPSTEALSKSVGDVRYSTHFSMRNEWSHVRLQTKVPGNMFGKKLAVGLPVMKETESGEKVGKVVTTWIDNVEWQMEQTFSKYKNNLLAFGKSTRTENGDYLNYDHQTSEVIKAGAGLFEQMEAGNTFYYNKFSLKLIEDALCELCDAKIDMNNRFFVIKTGSRGAIQLHKAILDNVSGWTQFTINADALKIVERTSSNLHSNALTAGFQFTEFKAPNGVRVKIEVDSFYDDPIRNKEMHPNGGPASSYRYDIFDIGSMDQPNIYKAQIKGKPEYRGMQCGFRNPITGETNINTMSFEQDMAVLHRYATLAVVVLDPTRTMSFIPLVLQG
jgi:hypothetical protein